MSWRHIKTQIFHQCIYNTIYLKFKNRMTKWRMSFYLATKSIQHSNQHNAKNTSPLVVLNSYQSPQENREIFLGNLNRLITWKKNISSNSKECSNQLICNTLLIPINSFVIPYFLLSLSHFTQMPVSDIKSKLLLFLLHLLKKNNINYSLKAPFKINLSTTFLSHTSMQSYT